MEAATLEVPSPIAKLQRDLKKASFTLSDDEARYLVDYYYIAQEDRKRAFNQERAMGEEPHAVITWLAEQARAIENSIKGVLGVYAAGHKAGAWAQSICGIGPVISAGLLAHIDITKAPTVGHIWSFAGLNPTVTWEKGQKRPWNAKLKVLCWKTGECFVKVQNNDKDIYGQVYAGRKENEIARNEAGEFADQAKAKLEKYKIGKNTDAYLWYAGCLTAEDAATIRALDGSKRESATKKLAGEPGSGLPMLPPAHIHARAKRYAVKLFISHFHEALYRAHYGKMPPKPYVLEHGGHAHVIVMPDPAGIFKE